MADPTNGPDRTPTPALGVQLLAATRNFDAADPIQAQADLLNAVAQRAAERACAHLKESNGRKDTGTWVRWGIGILVMILTLFWGVSLLFAERPTEARVEKILRERPQHLDTKDAVKRNTAALQQQQIQLNRIEDGVNVIRGDVQDLKHRK